MIRVAVMGAAGKMGLAVCDAVAADPELELAVRVDPTLGTGLGDLSGVDVAVDFTRPDVVMANARHCLEAGIHVVIGTTGLSDDDVESLRSLTGKANGFVAANFSIGAVLMMRFASQAARYMGSCEIVELHHNQKLDAPSGTAEATAKGILETWKASGRPSGGEAPDGEHERLTGSRGADLDGVHIHSVRLQGLVAHQEVLFGAVGQTLSIRHDSIDRTSFMPGVVLAVKKVGSMPGLTEGLEHLLD